MNSPDHLKINSPTEPRIVNPIQRRLPLQFITIVILPLSVLLIITTFAGLSLHQGAMRELAAERDERTVRSAANTISELIGQRVEMVQKLARDVSPGKSAKELETALTETASYPAFADASIAFFGNNGEMIASVGDPKAWEHLGAGQLLDLITEAEPTQPVYKLNLRENSGEPTLYIFAAGEDQAIYAAASFSPTTLIDRALADIFPNQGDHGIYVVSPNRQVIYRVGEGDSQRSISDHPGVNRALKGQAGSTYMQVGNDEHVVAFSPVGPFGWALVIEEPWSTIATQMLQITENAPLVLIPIVVVAVLALLFSSRYIVTPLQVLQSKAVKLGWGDYQAIEEPVGGIEEIRILQAELVHLAQKVQSAQKGLRDYIGAITLGQEEERRRLARELHDDTLQSLIALNQRLQFLQMSASNDRPSDSLSENLLQVQNLAEGTIRDLRRITKALRPIYLEDLGLAAALEMLAREIDQAEAVRVQFKKVGLEQRLAPGEELALYRIAQEALNNIVRHAGAGQAMVKVEFLSNMVVLQVSDDGSGFEVLDSPAAFAPGGHFGLLGLHERAEMVGAKLQIDSNAVDGSLITVTLPLRPVQE